MTGVAPDVLIVGAGAVGQVLGRHLHAAGARVSFFVKEQHRAEVERGFDLHTLHTVGAATRDPWKAQGVCVSAAEVARLRLSQAYLTVPSSAMSGPWLPALLAAAGEAIVVALQPSVEDHELLLAAGASPERLVLGVTSFVSFAAADAVPGGPVCTAVWFPPLSTSPFEGPAGAVESVVGLLRSGRFPASVARGLERRLAAVSALVSVYAATIEASGWSLDAFVSSGGVNRGARAAREAVAIVAWKHGSPSPGVRLALVPWVVRLGLGLAVRVAPFSLEAYVQRHFTKVGAQTRLLLSRLINQGHAAGLPCSTLEELPHD
jgi:ketopantoate reductase